MRKFGMIFRGLLKEIIVGYKKEHTK